MDNRARSSLTYRILTEVLGLALVLGAFSLSTVADYTAPLLARNVVLYVIVFAVLIVIWRRVVSMFELGILGGKVSALAGMVIALNIALAPVFLRILISVSDNDAVSNNAEVRSLAAALLAVGFGLSMLLLMFLVRRSHAYKSKSHWRLVHHALLIAGGVFLLSVLIPLSFAPVANIPVRFLLWAVMLAAMPLMQRMGSGMVPNPAQPQRAPSVASSSSSPAVAVNSSSQPSDRASEEREGHEGHRRPPRRGRGRFHRHSGPSRRRM
jgi:hypothetical protein